MRGLAAFAERALLLALSAGTAVTVLFVAHNRLAPSERPISFALAFLWWGLVFYLVGLVPPLLLVWMLARRLAWGWLPRSALALTAAIFLAAGALLNRVAIRFVFELRGPDHFRLLTPAALLLATAGLIASPLLPLDRRWLARALALLAPIAAAVAFTSRPGPGAGVTTPPRRAFGRREAANRLMVVGVDAADWRLIEKLISRGELPTIAALRARGAWGDLKTIVPTTSPAIWTTIVTGQPPKRHGVEEFLNLRMVGIHGVLREPRLPRGLGFAELYGYLVDSHRIYEGPVLSNARRSPAFWEIATAQGSPVSVVNWWATWPAEPVLGAIVSERVHYWRELARHMDPEQGQLTFPEDLYGEIQPLILSPDQVTYAHARAYMAVSPEEFAVMQARPFKGKTIESEFPYLYSMFETNRRSALHLIERSRKTFGSPADLLVLFRIVDIACHSAMAQSELVEDHLEASPEDVRRFGGVVSEAYRAVDRALAQILSAFGEANVLVVSDHGFQLEVHEKPYYHHMRGPPGIFLAAGQAFRPGRVTGLTIYDVMPLLACLKGFPVADDLQGRVPEKILDPAFLEANPIRHVARYGKRGALLVAGEMPAADEAMKERLRALGYVH